MTPQETYKQKLGFGGSDAVLGIEFLVKGASKYNTLTEEEQQAFFSDVFGGIVKVGVINQALAKLDIPLIPASMEPTFKEALLTALREEFGKTLADAI